MTNNRSVKSKVAAGIFVCLISGAAVFGVINILMKYEDVCRERQAQTEVPTLPLTLSLHDGRMVDGKMLRVQNTATNDIAAILAVASVGDCRGRLQVTVPAGGFVDIGRLEFNWSFEGKQRGVIDPEGYPCKLKFDIVKGEIVEKVCKKEKEEQI